MAKPGEESRGGVIWARVSPIVGLAVPLCLAVLLAEAFAPPSFKRFMITMLLNVIFVVGFYVFSGNSGLISFGHIGFAAIGAYVVALLTIPVIMKGVLLPNLPSAVAGLAVPTLVAMIIGALAVGAFAAFIGYPIVRLKGVGPGIATLAMLQVIHVVLQNWKSVTAGDSTLTGIPLDTTLPVLLVWTVVILAIAYLYQTSRGGRRLRASREDVEAARSVGIHVPWERYKALVLSAAIMAVGGGLYAHYLGSMSPKVTYLALGFLGILMAVVGGIKSLTGVVTGAVVVSLIVEGLRRVAEGTSIGSVDLKGIPGLQEVILALLLLVILVKMPSGLTGGREINLGAGYAWLVRRLRRRGRPAGRADSATAEADASQQDA
jgi:branched-chain amino acid transport system permease protein